MLWVAPAVNNAIVGPWKQQISDRSFCEWLPDELDSRSVLVTHAAYRKEIDQSYLDTQVWPSEVFVAHTGFVKLWPAPVLVHKETTHIQIRVLI